MSWYLLTTPRMTVYRLLLQSLENKLIVPGVVKMLSFYPVLLQIQIKSEKVVSERVPLLFDLIVSIFEEHSHRWTNAEQQDRLVYLLASLCRRKRPTKVKDSEDVIKSPLMGAVQSVLDGGTLLRFFVVPNLMKRVHEVLMLKLLLRLFQSVGTKEIYFEWTTCIDQNNPDSIQAPELIILVVELLVEYEAKNQQASDICRSIIKFLSKKLEGADIVFEKDTVDFLLFSLRRYQWWLRYAICSWFSYTLSTPTQQLPTGLYKSLPLDQQERCEQISVDFSFSPAECFFRSFFELALFDIELATDFLSRGISIHPRDENIVEKIALALVESYEQTCSTQSVASLAPLLQELMKVLDPSQEVRFIEFLCESTFHGLRLIQHLLLLSTAVKIAYYKSSDKALNNSTRFKDSVTDTAHVANALLQGFCELAKAHAEKEVVNLRRSKLPFPPEIKEDYLPPAQITIRRDERVYAQLSALFNISCSITRLVVQPPVALQVLINCLAELLFEVQKMRVGTFLDDLPSDHFKSNTVYAFAHPPHPNKEAGSPKQLNATNQVRGSSTHAATVVRNKDGTYSVENELFDPNSTLRTKGSAVEPLAMARQITGINMRKSAENRLSCKETLIHPTNSAEALSDQRDSLGKNGKKKRAVKRR